MEINLYDFDNTIYKGDSSTHFFFYCLLRKPIIIVTFPNIIFSAIKFVLKKIDRTEFKSAIFRFVKYIDVDKMVDEFWKSHKKNIKEFYKKKKHNKDIIISASPEFLLNPMKEYLGVLDLIGSIVDTKTGKFTKPNCHDEEKVRRLNKIYKNYKVKESYSDSKADIPILKLAEKPFYVKGEKLIPTEFK